MEKYKKAVWWFEKTLAHIPSLSGMWEPTVINLAHALRKLKRYREAITYYEKALALSTRSLSTYAGLAYTYHLQDNFTTAITYYHKLNDAAFNLSNGPVIDEFGQELGETLLNISRAWEQANTSTSTTLVGKLPLLLSSLTGNSKSAFGKRLVSAGRRFQSMGQYGQGELQTLEEGQVKMQSRLEEEEEAKEVYCNLKPEDKLSHVTSVSRDTGGGLIMVGDGINDAPALVFFRDRKPNFVSLKNSPLIQASLGQLLSNNSS
ncbi:Anaphase-promoting complex subunit 6 [Camellia lanceoleosa]|uniref:Anaphase-promoting complex subunit 6 n=1 Tax=Camellia lanceoleosa TaxID=1840588 RepID=A0ACC0HNA7_9ERIC|nr:Anaphase-promoting complex subunit 6 [Camellia lanceoleosa]